MVVGCHDTRCWHPRYDETSTMLGRAPISSQRASWIPGAPRIIDDRANQPYQDQRPNPVRGLAINIGAPPGTAGPAWPWAPLSSITTPWRCREKARTVFAYCEFRVPRWVLLHRDGAARSRIRRGRLGGGAGAVLRRHSLPWRSGSHRSFVLELRDDHRVDPGCAVQAARCHRRAHRAR